MQLTLLQIHLIPTQRDQLGDSQAVPVCRQNECAISVPMSPYTIRSGHKRVYFILRQVFT
jgi:hypothetical protein